VPPVLHVVTGHSTWPGKRTWLTGHLHEHPDHAWYYHAGHDFVLRSTADIAQEHERLHAMTAAGTARNLHRHGDSGKEKRVTEKKRTLDLLVTVEGEDPDGWLALMLKENLRLTASPSGRGIKVVKLARADGQEIGLEAAFEEWWQDQEPGERDAEIRDLAHAAFMYGAGYGREKKP
jgi:hypothetical protein